jgi:hypothetical protein
MKLTKTQQLMLYSLGHYYNALNQDLQKVLSLHTSKIAFIELLLKSALFNKKERALYLNLGSLEQKELIAYDNRRVFLTELGVKQFKRLDKEIGQYFELKSFFDKAEKPARKLQTTLIR